MRMVRASEERDWRDEAQKLAEFGIRGCGPQSGGVEVLQRPLIFLIHVYINGCMHCIDFWAEDVHSQCMLCMLNAASIYRYLRCVEMIHGFDSIRSQIENTLPPQVWNGEVENMLRCLMR